MKEIEAEKTKFIYFAKVDGLPEKTEIGLKVQDIAPYMHTYMRTQSERMSDFRLVLVKSFFKPDIANVYYLHWDNQQDLSFLDIEVEKQTSTNEDFRHSVKTIYQLTECLECHHIWDTLIVPPGDPYLGSPGLLEEKIRRRAFKICTNCNASLRQMVVKIFINS